MRTIRRRIGFRAIRALTSEKCNCSGQCLNSGSTNLLSGGDLQWHATGDPGTVIVEASTNLSTWIGITNLSGANGTFDFSDSTTNQSRRFYRLKLSP